MHRATPLFRAALGALLGLVVVAGLAGPAAAAPPPPGSDLTKISGASVGGVHAEVNPGTPIFNVEIVFTGIVGVNCTTLSNGALLYWKLEGNGRGLGGLAYRNLTGVLDLCPTGTSGQVTTARFTQSVLNRTLAPNPLEQLDVSGDIHSRGSGLTLTYAPIGGGDDLTMPRAPVWVGVGDGYTSATIQTPAVCSLTDAPCSSSASLNQTASSWVAKAVQSLNSSKSAVGTGWEISFVPLALDGTKAADLVPGSSQVTQLVSQLGALAPAPGVKRPGSWNWVGLTAGLVDSGITDALVNPITGWYAQTPNSLATTGASPNPWDVPAATTPNCPALGGVPAKVTANLTAIQAGIVNVYKAAITADPNVRIVHPQYPYFAESTINGSYTNPCWAQTKAAVDAIDDATALTALSAPAAAANVDLTRAFDLDLREAFGAHPTGELQSDGTRLSNSIQLAKPWGFPYPSGRGASQVASGVIGVINGQAKALPPVQRGDLGRPADTPSGWYRSAVDIIWTAKNQDTGTDLTDVRTSHLANEGYNWTLGPADQCITPILCADPVRVAAPIDWTPPTAGFRATDASGSPLTPNGHGWYNQPVTVYWAFAGNPGGPGVAPTDRWADLDPNTVPAGAVSTLTNAKNQTYTVPLNTMCDLAKNCALSAVPISVDTIAPAVAGTVTPGIPAGGWYNAASPTTITATWTATDGGSGIDGAGIVTASVDATGSGTFTAAGPVFTDIAGNTSSGADVTVKVDRVRPTVTLTGGASSGTLNGIPNGALYDATTMPAVFGCTASDAGGSQLKGNCSTTLKSATLYPSGLGTTFVYTVKATDNAGNLTSVDVTFNADGVTNFDQVKPIITITNVTQGARYTNGALPTPTCSGTDDLSGFKECTVSVSSTPLPAFGPPGKLYTVTATGTDFAGNVGTATPVTYTVFEITPKTTGRMTGRGKLAGSSTDAEFTLRCNGSPNQLDVEWSGGVFDLTSIDQIYCWDDPRFSEGNPEAPIDSLWAIGKGKLKNGKPATIEFTLTDQGEPGNGRDTLSFVIRDASGAVVLSSAGKLTGGGNVQAHSATGNDTNDDGQVNGPNGHYDGQGYDDHGHDRDGYDREGYDGQGYDRDGCDKRGYGRDGRKRKSAWSGYNRNGRDNAGYDKAGYDSQGYNRSGYNREGYDRRGYDRSGTDQRGVKRKQGERS